MAYWPTTANPINLEMRILSVEDKTILPITYTPDFVGEDFIIECKGNMNDAFPIRFKLFKYYLHTNNLNYKLFLPRNQKDVDKVVLELMNQDEGK